MFVFRNNRQALILFIGVIVNEILRQTENAGIMGLFYYVSKIIFNRLRVFYFIATMAPAVHRYGAVSSMFQYKTIYNANE